MLLLDAAVSLQLLQRRSGGRYGLGPLGAALIGQSRRGRDDRASRHALQRPEGSGRAAARRCRGRATRRRYWPYAGDRQPAGLPHEAIAPYTALMAASQPMIAQQVLSAYSFRGHRCLLDIGGGDGSFIAAVAAQAPKLRCVLFDLPAVADQASDRFRDARLSSRAVAIGGSFLTDRLPDGADIVSLVRVHPRPRRRRGHDLAARDPPGAAGQRHAADRRAARRHPRRRADRRRLFRLLPAGDGQRPAANLRAAAGNAQRRPASPMSGCGRRRSRCWPASSPRAPA